MKNILLYIFLVLVLVRSVNAQTTADSDPLNLAIPSLVELIDTAFSHSPLLKAQSKGIEAMGEEVKIERKKWMDYLYFEGAANYGMYDNLIVNGISNSIDIGSGQLTRNEQVRYYGGVSLKLPLSSISSTSNNVKVKRLREEQAEYQMQQLREDIKQLIIEEYFQLKYLHESMSTFNKINQTLEISLMKAEKDLVNGQMEFDDYGILVSTAGKSKNDYLKAKNSFHAQYNKLESMLGITFNPKN